MQRRLITPAQEKLIREGKGHAERAWEYLTLMRQLGMPNEQLEEACKNAEQVCQAGCRICDQYASGAYDGQQQPTA